MFETAYFPSIGLAPSLSSALQPQHSTDSTVRVDILIRRAELIYDIANDAYIVSHVLPEEAECVRHMIADIADEGNIDRVDRIIQLALDYCVEMLYPYARIPLDACQYCEANGVCFDNAMPEPGDRLLSLTFPSSYSQTTIRLMADYIHELVVARVLYGWLMLVGPDTKFAEAALMRVGNAKEGIVSCRNRRYGVLKRKQAPF